MQPLLGSITFSAQSAKYRVRTQYICKVTTYGEMAFSHSDAANPELTAPKVEIPKNRTGVTDRSTN